MTPSIVIAALQDGTATAEQVDWANRRFRVLCENLHVFGELNREEREELRGIVFGMLLDEPDDLSN